MSSDEGSSIRIEHLVPGGFHRVYRLAMYQNTTVVVKQVNAQSDRMMLTSFTKKLLC